MNNEHIDIIVEYADRKGLNAGFLVQQFLSAKDKLTLEEMGEIKTIVADTRKRLRMAEFKFTGKDETIFHFDEDI